MKLELERAVGDALARPEQGHHLVKHLKKIHDELSDGSSVGALASLELR
jgi:hypothetical protein